MGCDIHCYAEIKKSFRPECDPGWWKVGRVFPGRESTVHPPIEYLYERNGRGHESYEILTDEPVRWRDYHLFYHLAGVRGGPTTPMSEPRGIPEDASNSISVMSEGLDWHSHSWFTLGELKADGHRLLEELIKNLSILSRYPRLDDDTIRTVFWFDS